MTNYVVQSQRVGKGGRGVAGGGRGASSTAGALVAEKYYDAYDKYLRLLASGDGVFVGNQGVDTCGVGGCRRVEAPVWVGYSDLPAGVSVESAARVAGVLGVGERRELEGLGKHDRRERAEVPGDIVSGEVVVESGVAGDTFVGGMESGTGVCASEFEELQGQNSLKGKHYERNRAKRERAKELRRGVAGLKDVCPSLSGSVRTVDTRTAEEIEAVRTLAARRVAENKVARKMAELKLVSLNNKDKTDAVLRLEAARMEQRINEAKAKSQASFKKCDTSLKSLGSTGSAGEFALKQEVKRGRDNEIRLKYAQLQNDYMIKHVPEHVRQVILDMPEPVFEHDAEVFGECPEDYDDEQRMAYDIEMNSRAAGVQY